MSDKQNAAPGGGKTGSTRICALVGNFSDSGLDIAYRNFQGDQLNLDNIGLDFYRKTIVKKQKPKGGSYVR